MTLSNIVLHFKHYFIVNMIILKSNSNKTSDNQKLQCKGKDKGKGEKERVKKKERTVVYKCSSITVDGSLNWINCSKEAREIEV